jgi:indolepyruvate ferredoxin oxidoreductase beta subunit
MVLLGMAAPYIEILTVGQLRKAIATVFARKGEAVVEANLKAFDAGVTASAHS